MFTISKSVTIKTSKEKIWTIWSDVANWPQWDKEVEWAKLDGNFVKGATGTLKPKGGPASKFTVTECEKYKAFADVTPLPLTKLHFIHEMEAKNGELVVTHTVKMTGLLTFLFSRVIGKNIAKGLPKAMKNLKKVAEK